MAYSLGLLPFIFIKVLAPGYFARQDTKTPVKIGIIAMVVNMGLNIILMIYLAHVGLALATALSAMLNAFLLYRGLRKTGVYQPNAGWLSFYLRLIIANSVLLAWLWFLTPEIVAWQTASVWQRSQWLAMLICGSAITYFIALRLCGIRLKALIKPQDQL